MSDAQKPPHQTTDHATGDEAVYDFAEIARRMTGPMWSIWVEGWAATGDHGCASHVADVVAPTFREACALHYAGNGSYDADRNTDWGCRLFDNETDARRTFG